MLKLHIPWQPQTGQAGSIESQGQVQRLDRKTCFLAVILEYAWYKRRPHSSNDMTLLYL